MEVESNREQGTTQIRSYRDLTVWREAMDLVTEVYADTQQFPSDERFGLTSQMRRAVVSIPSNIAEGWGRNRTKEYIQHLRYASGSLREVETQVESAIRVGYVDKTASASLLKHVDKVSRMLRGPIRSCQHHVEKA